MNPIVKSSARAYNNALDLFEKVTELFMSLENSVGSEKLSIIKDVKYTLGELRSEYKKIKVDELKKEFDLKHVEETIHNMAIFRKTINNMSKKIMAIKYYDNIIPNINKYIMGVMAELDKDDIAKFGDNPKILKQKFLSKILAPRRIETFKLKLNQLSQSTMSQKMFNTIFKGLLYNHGIKTGDRKITPSGHPESVERAKKELRGDFKSLRNYKKDLGVPLMITNQMKSDLSNLGYTKEEIGRLTPVEAHKIINKSKSELDDNRKHAIERSANVKFRKKE